jgi:hypothetical protein
MSSPRTDVYDVLGPWAEADPIALHGLSPRLNDLSGKKIGLLCNNKRAAPLIVAATEKLLKQKYPGSQVSVFTAKTFSVSSLEKDREAEFNDWVEGVDAVIASVGD